MKDWKKDLEVKMAKMMEELRALESIKEKRIFQKKGHDTYRVNDRVIRRRKVA